MLNLHGKIGALRPNVKWGLSKCGSHPSCRQIDERTSTEMFHGIGSRWPVWISASRGWRGQIASGIGWSRSADSRSLGYRPRPHPYRKRRRCAQARCHRRNAAGASRPFATTCAPSALRWKGELMNMDTSQSVRFKHAVPTLPVRDAVAAQKYYCDVLGFKAEFMLNDSAGKPHFAGVSRDGVRLYLTTVNGEVIPASAHLRSKAWMPCLRNSKPRALGSSASRAMCSGTESSRCLISTVTTWPSAFNKP
jgi:hypothetical protein